VKFSFVTIAEKARKVGVITEIPENDYSGNRQSPLAISTDGRCGLCADYVLLEVSKNQQAVTLLCIARCLFAKVRSLLSYRRVMIVAKNGCR
jgi:hypothetical protein